jgi:hypothetical protein
MADGAGQRGFVQYSDVQRSRGRAHDPLEHPGTIARGHPCNAAMRSTSFSNSRTLPGHA